MEDKDPLEVGIQIHEDLLKYLEEDLEKPKENPKNRILLVGSGATGQLAIIGAFRDAINFGTGLLSVDTETDLVVRHISTTEYFRDIQLVGKKPNILIWDDLEERVTRGSGKSLSQARYLKSRFDRIPYLPTDQRKGPKGPRGKWGKIV